MADLTWEFINDIRQQALAEAPAEKEQMVKDMAQTGKELADIGSDFCDGRGQMIGSIPPRIYFRWNNIYPGCWKDRQFVDEFLTDNPQCCGIGYRPKAYSLRKSISMGGKIYHENKKKI